MTINYATGSPVVVKSVKTYTSPAGTVCDQVDVWPDGTSNNRSHCTLVVPRTTSQLTPTPIVMALHGSGGTVHDVIDGSIHAGGLTDAWVDQGWIVVGMAGSGDGVPRWGFEPARLGAASAWRYIELLFTPEPHGLLIYGLSMGGEYGINVMVEAGRQSPPIPIAAWCGNSPALNLQWIAGVGPAYTLRPSLSDAYFGIAHAFVADGGTVTPGDAAWVLAVETPDGGHDPLTLDLNEIAARPMRTYVGDTDTLILRTYNGIPFDQRLTDASWPYEHELITFTGGHGGPDSYRPAEVVAFFNRALAL